MNDLEYAIDYAKRAHKGQMRKFGGAEYVNHPIKVAILVKAYFPSLPDATVYAALLHDVVEDTDIPTDLLFYEFGLEVASLVFNLTKTYQDDAPYEVKVVSELNRYDLIQNEEVLAIKLCDIYANLCEYRDAPVQFLKKFVDSKKRLVGLIGIKDIDIHRGLIGDIYDLIEEIELYISND